MKRAEAIQIVNSVSKTVPAIVSGEVTKAGASPVAEFKVKDGRTIRVEADYGSWEWRQYFDDADRVRLQAGVIGSGKWGKRITRTFRVRKDGTLNTVGIAKALAELAAMQVADVVKCADRAERERLDHGAAEDTKRVLAVVTGKFYDEQFERLQWSDRLQAGDFPLQVQVKSDGRVKITIDNLAVASVQELLKLLNFEKEALPLKSDV